MLICRGKSLVLAPGSHLGTYEILSLLGAGGMGEVYRARDLTLHRDVAIKVLSEAFTSHPNRLARFEREARILAALTHPNICAIHGIQEHDGFRFLVLELIVGQTLYDRLAAARIEKRRHCGLPLGETLAIARQIAEALEAAHDRGIVHRDLKTSNIMIGGHGVVKVLDFGLAKAVHDDTEGLDLNGTHTFTHGEGALLGTAAYMSPEQARGQPLDKRTDIWAFGCVLYEMLTGRVAFGGDTSADSIVKILEREADWSALPPTVPSSVRRLLARCLVKDPHGRLRDIGDARIEIDAADDVTIGPPRSPAWRTWLPWAAVLALLAAIAAVLTRAPNEPDPTSGAAAAMIANPLRNARFTALTRWPGTETAAEISPDGRFFEFLSDRNGEMDLWWGQVERGEPRNLTGELPALSTGVMRTAGFTGDGLELWYDLPGQPPMRMPQTGGTPRPFLGVRDLAPAWSGDNRLVFFTQEPTTDTLHVADATGANATLVPMSTTDPEWSRGADTIHVHNPVWSRDNQWIYFLHGFIRDWNHQSDAMDIWRVAVAGGTPARLTRLNRAITFIAVRDERTLFFIAPEEDGSGSWLWSLDIPTGATRRITTGLEQYTSVASSRDGRRLVLTRANPTVSLWTLPLAPFRAVARDATPYAVGTDRGLAPRFSAGGDLFYLSSRGGGDGIWRSSGGSALEVRSGADGAVIEPAAPSRDGGRVAAVVRERGRDRLAVMLRDGTGSRVVADSVEPHGAADWSPDGQWVVIGGADSRGPGLFKVASAGDSLPVRLVDGLALNPIWSPRGDLIVYGGAFAAGQVSLFSVRPDGTPTSLPSLRVRPGGYRFLPDGGGLVYLPRPESQDFSLLDLVTGVSRQITHLDNRGTLRSFDVTPDGRHLVFDRTSSNSDIILIEIPQD